MATKKPKAAQKKSGGAKAKAAKGKPAKGGAAKAAPKKAAPAAKAKDVAKPAVHPLAAALAAHLKISPAQAIEKALGAYALQVGLLDEHGAHAEAPAPHVAEKAGPRTASASIAPGGYLPRRLYLHLNGRGLDGAGMPVEVIDVPYTIGSGRRNTLWINSPQIETVHAQILQTDGGWLFEDQGSEHGTYLNEQRIKSVLIHDGDTFLLAGYLRVKAELR